MRLNRREFVRLGTLGAAGVYASSCGSCRNGGGNNSLQLRVKGLSLAQRMPSSVNLHLIDGNAVGMGVHQPILSVSTSMINSAGTVAPSQVDPDDSNRRMFDLTGKTLTITTGIQGAPDLVFDDDPIDSSIPSTDDGWRSIKYAARLSTLCGATKIVDNSKFSHSLTLDHGRLRAIKPHSPLGQATVWTFNRQLADGSMQEVAKQPMTDQLQCVVRVSGPTVTFVVGGQPVVVDVGSPGDVLLQNLPPHPRQPGVCAGANPCVDHLAALYDLVDFQFKPTASGMVTKPLLPQIEPNYCPPGSI